MARVGDPDLNGDDAMDAAPVTEAAATVPEAATAVTVEHTGRARDAEADSTANKPSDDATSRTTDDAGGKTEDEEAGDEADAAVENSADHVAENLCNEMAGPESQPEASQEEHGPVERREPATVAASPPPPRRSRSRRNTIRSPQVDAFIRSARRSLGALLGGKARGRRRSESFRLSRTASKTDEGSEEDGAEEAAAAPESAPAVLEETEANDDMSPNVLKKKRNAGPAEASDSDVSSSIQSETESAPLTMEVGGADGGSGASESARPAETRRARARRRRRAAVSEISESRLMEESPPEPATVLTSATTPTRAASKPAATEVAATGQQEKEGVLDEVADGDTEAVEPLPPQPSDGAELQTSPKKRSASVVEEEEAGMVSSDVHASAQKRAAVESETGGPTVTEAATESEAPAASHRGSDTGQVGPARSVVSTSDAAPAPAPAPATTATTAAATTAAATLLSPMASFEPSKRSVSENKSLRRARRSRRSVAGQLPASPSLRLSPGLKRSPAGKLRSLRSRLRARRSLPATAGLPLVSKHVLSEMPDRPKGTEGGKNTAESEKMDTSATSEKSDVRGNAEAEQSSDIVEKRWSLLEAEMEKLESGVVQRTSPRRSTSPSKSKSPTRSPSKASPESSLQTTPVKRPAPMDLSDSPQAPATAATLSLGTDADPAEDRPAAVPASAGLVKTEPSPVEHEGFAGTPLKRAVVRLSRLTDVPLCKARRQLGMDSAAVSPTEPCKEESGAADQKTEAPTTGAGAAAEVVSEEGAQESIVKTGEPAVASAPAAVAVKADKAAAAAADPPTPPAESEELFVSPELVCGPPAPSPAPASVTATSRAARLVGLAQKRQAPPAEAAGSPERPSLPPPPTPSTPVHRPLAPWARHVYSPQASPSAGILKRRRLMGPAAAESPPTPGKRRAVQFCDPPVSDSVEIPPAVGRQVARSRGRGRGRRELRLGSSQEFDESPPPPAGATVGLCPQLANCTDSVSELVDKLTSASWRIGLLRLLSARGISTIGQLATLPAAQLAELPVRSPRLQTVEAALNAHLALREKRAGSELPSIPSADGAEEVPDVPEPPPSPHASTQTSVPSVCSTPTQSDSPSVSDASTATAAAADTSTASSQTPAPPSVRCCSQQTVGPGCRSVAEQACPTVRHAAAGTEPTLRRTVSLQTAQPSWRHVCLQVVPLMRDAAAACAPPPPPPLRDSATQTDGDEIQLITDLASRAGPEGCLQALLGSTELRRAAARLLTTLLEEIDGEDTL